MILRPALGQSTHHHLRQLRLRRLQTTQQLLHLLHSRTPPSDVLGNNRRRSHRRCRQRSPGSGLIRRQCPQKWQGLHGCRTRHRITLPQVRIRSQRCRCHQSPRLRSRRHFRQRKQTLQSHLSIHVLRQSTSQQQLLLTRPKLRQDHHRIPTNPRRRMTQRTHCRRQPAITVRPQCLQHPQRMNRTDIQTYLVHTRISHQPHQMRYRSRIGSLHQQTLSLQTPHHRRMTQHFRQPDHIQTRQRLPAMQHVTGCLPRRHNSINSTTPLIPQITLVSIPTTRPETLRSRIVLNDVVVPVDDPHRTVRTNLRHNRRCPLIVTRNQIVRTGRLVTRAITTQHKRTHQMPRRLTHKSCSVPPLLRKCSRRIQRMTRTRSVTAKLIHLTHVLSHRLEQMSISNGANVTGSPATHLLVKTIGNRHECAGVMIRRGTKNQSLFADAQTPRVVVRRTHKLQIRHLRRIRAGKPESPETLAKRLSRLPRSLRTVLRTAVVVTLHRPDPVVQPITEITHAPMSIPGSPARNQHLFQIRPVVPVSVLQINRLRRVLNHRTASVNHDRRGNRQTLGKHRKSVRHMVAIRILTDPNPVPILTQLIRIVHGLTDPQPTTLVPVHRNRLGHKTALIRVQSQCHALRSHIVLHRLFDRQRLLHRRPRRSLDTPLTPRSIIRDLRPHFHIFKCSHVLTQLRHGRNRPRIPIHKRRDNADICTAGPANATLHQIRKTRVRPRPLIMPPRRIKHSTLPMSPRPRPRLTILTLRLLTLQTILQYLPVLLVVQMMDVRLVPTAETPETLHDRMLRSDNLSPKDLTTMPLKLRPHQLHHLRIVPPAERRTVQRNKTLPARHKIQHRLRLHILDPIDVRIQYQTIKLTQHLRRQILHPIRILHADPTQLQHRCQLVKTLGRTMMPIVPHKQQLQISGTSRPRQQQTAHQRPQHLKTFGIHV